MSNKVLIVIDMQNDFIDGSLANPMAQEIVEPICDYINHFYGQICATMDTHHPQYLVTNEGRHLPIEHCMYPSYGWLLNKRIYESLGESAIIVQKPTFGCLQSIVVVRRNFEFGTKFDLSEYDTIELVGVCTDICVISNALILKSAYPEANIIVHANLCAGTTKEMHECALKVMESCQIEVRR